MRPIVLLRTVLLFTAVTLLGGCTSSSANDLDATPSPGPALWSLADDDSTIYLFGTVHILRPETQWRGAHIDQALAAADSLYFEADTESPEVQAELTELIRQTGIYNDGRSLLTVLGNNQLDTVQSAAELLQVPMGAIAPLKPWMAGLQLSVLQLLKNGYAPESGVETVLLRDPTLAAASRGYFETAEQQIRLFDELAERDQIEMLVAGARFIVEDPDALDALVDAWSSGNVEELGAQLASVESFGNQVVYDAVLTERNRSWIPLIEALLDTPGTKFVAVGAGHLAGADSVISMLKKNGHRIRRH